MKPDLKGALISINSGNIDFKTLTRNIDFVIIETGTGLHEDVMVKSYMKLCKQNGIAVLGFMHNSRAANPDEAFEEAEFACKIIDLTGLTPDKPYVFINWSKDSDEFCKQEKHKVTKEMQNQLARAFVKGVRAGGYKGGICFGNDPIGKRYQHKTLQFTLKYETCPLYEEPQFDNSLFTQYGEDKVNGIENPVKLLLTTETVSIEARRFIICTPESDQ